MADPHFPEGPATMFHCGGDAPAKAIAAQLAKDLGFEPVDAGPLTQARLLEPLALLWITLAYRQGLGREFAFRLVHR
jgi:predicted dinucleotide-binding enzyme